MIEEELHQMYYASIKPLHHQLNANHHDSSHCTVGELCVCVLLQHFLSDDYVKKRRTERKRNDTWEQDEFVSFKSIENDRSVCVDMCLYYIIILCRVT